MAMQFNPMWSDQPGGAINAVTRANNSLNDEILKTHMQAIQNKYQPRLLQNQTLQGQLANQKSQAEQPYWGPQAQANLSGTQLSNQRQQFMNQNPLLQMGGVVGEQAAMNYLQKTGDIQGAKQIKNYMDAEINYKQMGGFGGMRGVDMQTMTGLTRAIAQQNPNASQQEIDAIRNAYLEGQTQLPNGQSIAEPSGDAKYWLNRAGARQATSANINQMTRARQAEAEIGVLSDYANKGIKPYATTYSGYSPEQIYDTLKTDKKSQKQLGRFVGSQALQFEIAQLRTRLAQGQPSVAATEELMSKSGQIIKEKFPRLSAEARQEASDYINEALKEGLRAREKSGIDYRSAFSKGAPSSAGATVTIRNKNTGEIKTISAEEAKKLGVPNV